jgi:Protein of unknown function (DUF2934)
MSDTMAEAEERVRERAYFLWEREGCPEGRADEHWRRAVELEAAEATLRGQRRPDTGNAEAAGGSPASAASTGSARNGAKRRAPSGAAASAGAAPGAERDLSHGASRRQAEPVDASAPQAGARPRRQPSAAAPRGSRRTGGAVAEAAARTPS